MLFRNLCNGLLDAVAGRGHEDHCPVMVGAKGYACGLVTVVLNNIHERIAERVGPRPWTAKPLLLTGRIESKAVIDSLRRLRKVGSGGLLDLGLDRRADEGHRKDGE